MNDAITGVEGDLRSNGISVESLHVGEESVTLEYLTAFPDVHVNHAEIGRVLTTFIDRAEADEWDPVRIDATVRRHEDDVQGTWHAEAEWFERYLGYELSDEDFSELVLSTLEEGAST
ncbi:hypothetical protein SAMN04487947_2636 [Halogeometricum rufum]|jgi:hypothetical protein|uniref:DUF8159 domain-containing protein n=1 Tax=Halogeometricum rufum TaxID=553469 RepID=A0A1I6HY15_9EURY|nr:MULTISPECIES: hypothetical protein [Halogeometricum]MUV56903.1 hypothetical protein [Halogeometricum sp. CBA1124]SFR59294.1 hypothetical protein SAMN04487947_2636 [Halogeometricum rufum]